VTLKRSRHRAIAVDDNCTIQLINFAAGRKNSWWPWAAGKAGSGNDVVADGEKYFFMSNVTADTS
jgi:hypothetical protein